MKITQKKNFKTLSLLSLCVFSLFCTGCVSKTVTMEDPLVRQERFAEYFQEQDKSVLIPVAQQALGIPYKYGGTTTKGFDCSGFVQWAYKHAGITLPRTARAQSQVGEAVKKKEDLQVGDIVAFRHPRRGYHTGIYLGNGKFIHSPRKRTVIRLDDLSTSYFRDNFLGARRLPGITKQEKLAAMTLQKVYYTQKKREEIKKAQKNKEKK